MITLAYMTNRRNPRIEWFLSSVYRQLGSRATEFELIVVDFHLATLGQFLDYGCHFKFSRAEVLEPKPTPWQGKYKRTKRDWFAASNSRNTAIAAARGDYIMFCDDLSVPQPGWVDQVLHAATHKYCLMGAYKKTKAPITDPLNITGEFDVDSRWNCGSDLGIVSASGSMLFGCSFGAPLDLLLKVDGLDEACDGQGAEDYDLGIRLERAGGSMFYNRNCLTIEDGPAHFEDPPFLRVAKKMPQGVMSDHFMLDRLRSFPGIYQPRQETGLVRIRTFYQQFGTWPDRVMPTTDWRDGQPLSEM